MKLRTGNNRKRMKRIKHSKCHPALCNKITKRIKIKKVVNNWYDAQCTNCGYRFLQRP